MSISNTRLRRCDHDIARCRSLTETAATASHKVTSLLIRPSAGKITVLSGNVMSTVRLQVVVSSTPK